jgi:hypothetical protein
MRSLRLIAAAGVLLLAACTNDAPTAAVATTTAPSLKTAAVPAGVPNLAGHWVESPKLHYVLPAGNAQEVWYEFDVTQSGTTLSGTVRRYVSYFDAAGNPTVVRFDLGSPGKVSGSVTATQASIGFIKVNEGKQNLGYFTTITNGGTYLSVDTPTQFGAAGFTR